MTVWETLCAYLPAAWTQALEALTYEQKQQIRELHIRAGEPLRLSTGQGMRYLCRGGLTALRQPGLLLCSRQQLSRCVALLCDESVYAYQDQLRQGYIPLPGGIRVGVAGRALLRGAGVAGVQDITSLCIRLPGRHFGCGAALLSAITAEQGLHSSLLVGEPASGKTTLLRDVAAGLAAQGCRVTVVDERGELAGVDGLPGCDVLAGYPKAVGILQAVRCLSPQVVVFDELGTLEEARAVAACAHAGVAVIASLHGEDAREIACRPAAAALLAGRAFDRWFFLEGRTKPGVVKQCLQPEVVGNEICWSTVDCAGGRGTGTVHLPPAVPSGEPSAAAGAGAGEPAAAAYLFRSPYGRAVAAAGRE